jgi:hypothetical protein
LELEEKNKLIDELEIELSNIQLDYSTLNIELSAFRNRYYLRIGFLYARLDIIRAEILQLEANLNPNNFSAAENAQAARDQAKATCDEVNDSVMDEQINFKPSQDLKQIYRQAAKLIHPDRSKDDEDRKLREHLMAEINIAYARGDTHLITDLMSNYQERLSLADSDEIGVQLVRAIRIIAKTKHKIAELHQEIYQLKNSTWYQLKTDIEESELRGEDALGDLAENIHKDILEAQATLSNLRLQFTIPFEQDENSLKNTQSISMPTTANKS